MKNGAKIAIVVLLAVAVAAMFALRGGKRAEDAAATLQPAAVAPAAQAQATQPSAPVSRQDPPATPAPAPAAPVASSAPKVVATAAKPRLLELGSLRCMACQEMAKVLDQLRASQGPKLQVDFIDVFEQPEAGDRYQLKLIPTQILFDAGGEEIFRHTGYFSHDDILAKFRELGVRL